MAENKQARVEDLGEPTILISMGDGQNYTKFAMLAPDVHLLTVDERTFASAKTAAQIAMLIPPASVTADMANYSS